MMDVFRGRMSFQPSYRLRIIHTEGGYQFPKAWIFDGLIQHQKPLIDVFCTLLAGTEKIRYLIFFGIGTAKAGNRQLQRVVV